MTPYIDSAFDPRIDEYEFVIQRFSSSFIYMYRIILDGEMLVWDPVSERNLPFGTLKTAAIGASFANHSTLAYTIIQIDLRRSSTRAHAVSTIVDPAILTEAE